MVEAPLVVPDLEFGKRVLHLLDAARFRFTVALWLKSDDDWSLVIGTPVYEEAGPIGAYSTLRTALSTDGRVIVSDLPIRLEGQKNPFIKSLRKIFAKTASVEGMRLGGQRVGGTWIDDAYVYRIK